VITEQHQGIDAESAILGAVFLDPIILDDMFQNMDISDFSHERYQIIWKAIAVLYKKSFPVDLLTVIEMLSNTKHAMGTCLDAVGGFEFIMKLSESCPTSANVNYYIGIVKSQSIKRRSLQAAQRIATMIENKEFENDEDLYREIERIADIRPNGGHNMKAMSDTREEYATYLETKDEFIYSGFKSFDEWLGGYGKGWFIVKAGRPSVGKTAKALCEARNIATQDVGPVLFWSQEMKREQLFNRMISSMTYINGNAIRKKQVNESQKKTIMTAYDELGKLPLHFADGKNVSIEEVRAVSRQFKRSHKRIGAIYVDYLTIMDIQQQKNETYSRAVGRVTQTAKQIAQEMDCPFIMLAQLSRDGKDEPKLEHLRDSGEIEQTADVVEFLWHNPEDTSNDPESKIIQCIIAKGRDVGVNRFRYRFKGWNQTYEEMS
jgi:replicative DNA helicase